MLKLKYLYENYDLAKFALKNWEYETETLSDYLQNRSYPAVIPVASNSGEFVVTLDSSWGKYYASVFKGVDGNPIEDTDCNDHILYAYGKALGQLHMLSAEYSPEIRKWTYHDVLLWIGKVLKEYHAPNKMLVELEKVQQALNELPQTSNTFGLIHYDFEPDNVFWDEDKQCCTVIDFKYNKFIFQKGNKTMQLSSQLKMGVASFLYFGAWVLNGIAV